MPELASPKIPKYWALTERLRSEIQNGSLRPGDMLPSLAQVQVEHKVSLNTANRAFAELEKAGLIVRVQGRGTFVASRRRQTGLIGFLGHTFAHRQSSLPEAYMAEAIESAVKAAGKSLITLRRDSSVGWDQVEGVLILGYLDKDVWVRAHYPLLPAVLLLEISTVVPSVAADEFGGARTAVQHLLALGHTRIGGLFNEMSRPRPTQTTLRFEGYLVAMRAAKIEPQPDWICSAEVTICAELGYRRWGYLNMRHWLQTGWGEGCTALVVQNDLAAIGVMEALHEVGLRVPQDVSVIGFDGTEVCKCTSPTLSAVEIPLRDIGRHGVELLLQQMEGELSIENVVLPTRVRQRESTGPCRGAVRPTRRRKPIEKSRRRLEAEHARLWSLVEGK